MQLFPLFIVVSVSNVALGALMNAVGWIKLKSGASSVGGKMKVLKSLPLRVGIETSAITSAVHMVPTNSKWTYDLLPNSSFPEYSASKNGSLYPQEFFVYKIRNYSKFLQQESRYVSIHSPSGITS